jgi:hypothetical protein
VLTEALARGGLPELVSGRQDGLVDPTVDGPSRPVLPARNDNALADDLGVCCAEFALVGERYTGVWLRPASKSQLIGGPRS